MARTAQFLRQAMADRDRKPTGEMIAHRQRIERRAQVLQRYGRLVAAAMERAELTAEQGVAKVMSAQERTALTLPKWKD